MEFVSNNIIPNETILVGKVVFIERSLVTIKIVYNSNIIYGYIKGEDLAWGRVLNAADVVFLGEELKVKYLGNKEGKLYFDLKWQQWSLYPELSFDATIDELLEKQGIITNLFYGKAIIITTENESEENDIVSAYATDLIAEDSGARAGVLIDPFTGAQVNAFIPKKYAYALENGKYYRFILTLADKMKRVEQHRLYMCSAEPYNSKEANNPYKLIVEQSFKENKSPKSNRESASYLKEIGADMYTGRDRMFYELLQNADDSASQKGVRMMIQIKDNYLILTHDGLPFSRQDFRSIVSTANSTKRLDRKKTGYKGIGFKSVLLILIKFISEQVVFSFVLISMRIFLMIFDVSTPMSILFIHLNNLRFSFKKIVNMNRISMEWIISLGNFFLSGKKISRKILREQLLQEGVMSQLLWI